jgi:hypothetical protein
VFLRQRKKEKNYPASRRRSATPSSAEDDCEGECLAFATGFDFSNKLLKIEDYGTLIAALWCECCRLFPLLFPATASATASAVRLASGFTARFTSFFSSSINASLWLPHA